jgi:mannose-6-phosphate isomerase-like protein (cupin superfamily)
MHTTYRPHPQPEFALRGIAVTPLATAADTAAAWEAIHQRVSPGGGSPMHTLGTDKLFVVLAGEPTLIIDGVERVAGPGASATVPPGVPHRFENRSGGDAELLVITSGADHVEFLRGMAQLGRDGGPTVEALHAHAAAHHVELLV